MKFAEAYAVMRHNAMLDANTTALTEALAAARTHL
jgi:hypothetical protein